MKLLDISNELLTDDGVPLSTPVPEGVVAAPPVAVVPVAVIPVAAAPATAVLVAAVLVAVDPEPPPAVWKYRISQDFQQSQIREERHTSRSTHGTGVSLNVGDVVLGTGLHGAVMNAVTEVLAGTQALQVVGLAAQRACKTQHVVVAHMLSTSN